MVSITELFNVVYNTNCVFHGLSKLINRREWYSMSLSSAETMRSLFLCIHWNFAGWLRSKQIYKTMNNNKQLSLHTYSNAKNRNCVKHMNKRDRCNEYVPSKLKWEKRKKSEKNTNPSKDHSLYGIQGLKLITFKWLSITWAKCEITVSHMYVLWVLWLSSTDKNTEEAKKKLRAENAKGHYI